MEDSPNSGCQDENDVENESDDPVEECSDAEAPSHPPPEPRTPHGVAGRFASLLGVPRSGSKLATQDGDDGGDDIIGATQHGPKSLDKGARAAEDDVALSASTGITQQLEEVMGSFPGNLEDRLAALEGTPLELAGEGAAAAEGAPADAAPDLFGGAQVHDDGTMAVNSLEELPAEEDLADAGGAQRPTEAEPFLFQGAGCEAPAGEEQAAGAEAPAGAAASQEAPAPAGTAEGGEAPAPPGSQSDSDAEDAAGAAAAGPAAWLSAQEALPTEPWMSRPAQERELWERVRPRALRREAAQLQALRLPAAAVSRLMRLNPALQVRSTEALELLNYATLLILQAVARSAAKGKAPGQRVQFEDIRSACGGVRELQFLHPLSCTLDASARVMRRDEGPAEAEADAGAEGGGVAGRRQQLRFPAAPPPPEAGEPGGEDEGEGAEREGEATPAPRVHAGGGAGAGGRGAKRKGPPDSAQKTNAKASRTASGGRAKPAGPAAAGPGIAAFFKRVAAAE